jgi:hypothetical protein
VLASDLWLRHPAPRSPGESSYASDSCAVHPRQLGAGGSARLPGDRRRLDAGQYRHRHHTTPAVAVDAAGTAYIAWEDSSTSAPFLHYCKLPAGATACSVGYTAAGQAGGLNPPQQSSCAGLLGSPSVILEGNDVLVFAYDNCSGIDNGEAGWVSTDGGKTFTNEPPGDTMSFTPPNNDSTTTNPVTALGNGLVGVGYVVPLGSPQFQAVQYDPTTSTFQANFNGNTGPFATLDPSNTYAAGNLGGEFAAQPFGTSHAGVMGAIEAFPSNDALNPCHDALPFTAWSFASLGAGTTQAGLNTNPGVPGSAWSQPLTPLDCHSENPAIAGGAGGFGVLDGFFSGGATVYHRYNESDGKFDLGSVTLAHESEVSPSLSQDAGGGVYATWSTGLTDLRLAYSPNGGSAWDGPVTLANSTASGDRLTDPASAVNGAGKGWAAYSLAGTEYAQPFAKADAIVPPTVSGSGVSNGSTVTITITCLQATPCTFTITISGTEVTVTQASAARKTHKHTITIATGRFTVNGKKSKKVALRLTKAGKALLAKDHGHLHATILLALKVSGVAKKTTRGISITTKRRR